MCLQSVVSAALRAVGNIVTGDDIQTQVGSPVDVDVDVDPCNPHSRKGKPQKCPNIQNGF